MNATVSKFVRNCTSGVVAFAAASAVCPMSAFAEESGAGIEAILPQMEEFIPMLVAFIILWIVLAKFGWPKFEGMLEKRENTIKNNLEKAEEAPRHGNPKQMQRKIKRQLAAGGLGTKSQQALQLQREMRKLARRDQNRQQSRQKKEEKFALRQKKRKEKHRGR